MQRLHTSLLLFCLLICYQLSVAQNIWQNISEDEIIDPDGIKELFPNQAAYYDLEVSSLRQILQNAPSEENVSIQNSSTIIPVPFPSGKVVRFRVVSYQMLEPELAVKFPNIRNFRGVAVDDPSTSIRFDWTVRGFRAMLRKDGQQIFIDPYARGNQRYYMSYFKKDYPESMGFECLFNNGDNINDKEDSLEKSAGDCQFRSYRLAVTTTAEYSNFFGANSAAQSNLVLAEVNTAINRVNEVYERDLGVRLVLIANTENVFYYNAGTDPYTNGNPNALIGQSQSTINSVIGSANYDVGHLFGTGADSGLAALESVCSSGSKAEGVTLRINPTGDPFYIDYLAHELGHQFGGNLTQNNNCNRSSFTSYEPGSASTIMGYAGICSPNVQSNSDAYFHAISVQEMSNFITGSGNSCANIISTANIAPIVTDPGDFAIPRSTPFVLNASATDANSDPMTYCWEQWDRQVATMPPQSTNGSGPLFRSLLPISSSERYFINLPDLAAGSSPTWEVLPSVARDMNFRVTVRDNNSEYGCTDEQTINVEVTNSAPFVVQAPNTNVTLSSGQTYNVQWDEAQTPQSPISCGTVDIFLSTDGGLSFPTLLLAGTNNDGAADVTIPSIATTTARIMVRCSEGVGIFFDISDTNFGIEISNPDYTLSASPNEETNCGGNSVTYTINVGSLAGFSDPVTLSATGLPVGVSTSFAPNPVIPGNASTLTLSNLNAVSDGTYNFNVEGSSSSGNKSISLVLNIVTPSSSNLLTPADGATDVSTAPTLTWDAAVGVTSYDVQVATDAGFSNVVASTNVPGTSWVVSPSLNIMTIYFWRVRHVRSCGNDPWSSTFSFTTASAPAGTCDNPISLACGDSASGNTADGQINYQAHNGGDPGSTNWTGPELVYEIIVPTSDVTISVTNLSMDLDVYLLSVCTDPLGSEIAFSENGNTDDETINAALTAGTYYVMVDGWDGASGTFDISLSCTLPPVVCGVDNGFYEDFEAGQASGWTFNVTGTPNVGWQFDNQPIGITTGTTTPNPGSGNWAYYDDDAAGNGAGNNIATATSPNIDMSTYQNISLAFDYAFDDLTNGGNETVTLSITDGSSTYYWNGSSWVTTSSTWLGGTDATGSFAELIPMSLNSANLSITLEYNDDNEWAWGFGFDNFGLCGDEISDPCPPTLAENGDPMNNNEIEPDTYKAQNTITSTGVVASPTTVTFEAGQSIILSPDFMAENGSTFTARIQACMPAADNSVVEERNEEVIPVSDEIRVYPNPFSHFTTIEVQLAEQVDLEIELYSLTGKKLKIITTSNQIQAGNYQFSIDASNFDSGIYLLMIRIDDEIQTRKLSLIK